MVHTNSFDVLNKKRAQRFRSHKHKLNPKHQMEHTNEAIHILEEIMKTRDLTHAEGRELIVLHNRRRRLLRKQGHQEQHRRPNGKVDQEKPS